MDFHAQRILVTGANGFVGRALCERLVRDGWHVRGAVRRDDTAARLPKGVEGIPVGEIGPHTDWSDALKGIERVVHLAARVHVMSDHARDPLAQYKYVNTYGTERLALMAAENGVKEFVYMSSVKVNGEATDKHPFTEADIPSPQDPYAISKWEAEQILQRIARQTGMGIAILRPPLVYGPGVGANFFELIRVIDRGIPLPLRGIQNRRSMVYVENLVDAIAACLECSAALGEVFLVSDNEIVSTPELITRIAHALGKAPRLWVFPKSWLLAAARLLKRRAMVDRLVGSLVVDDTKIRRIINWQPPFSMNEGLRRTADWYAKNKAII